MPSRKLTMPLYPFLLVLTVGYAAVAFEDLPPKETRPPTIVPPSTPDEDTDIRYFDIEGEQGLELPCRANGDKPITYKWTKNGQTLDLEDAKFISNTTKKSKFVRPNVATGDIILTEHVDSDEGIYQCRASNVHGASLSKPIYLYKATKRTFQMGEDKIYKRPLPYESLVISCDPPENHPPGKVRWIQFYDLEEGKKYVELNERVAQDNDGSLYFANVIKEDENMGEPYACELFIKALNMYTVGPYVYIKLREGVETPYPVELLYYSETSVVGLKGEPIQFKCIFTGNPTPTITWVRIKGQLDNARMRANAQKLTIYDMKYEDAGVYECQGRNSVVNIPQTKRFTLKVEAKPEWVAQPRSVDAGVEESAVFECGGTGRPTPKVEWFINGQDINTLVPDPNRILSEGQLRFVNLDRDDAQVIQCNVSNKHGYLWADVALSILAYQPELKAGFEKLRVAEDQKVVLPCEIDGKPKPIVYWKRGAQKIEGGPYIVHPNGNMTISSVTLKDAANWTCYAENRYGKFNKTGELIVREKTRIVKAPTPPQQKIRHGSQTLFECSARTDEHEQLRITWLFNGNPIDVNNPRLEIMADYALRIQGLTSQDTGNYTCVASNGLDQDVASAQVKVIAPPDPPANVSFTTCLSRSATVTWSPGSDNFSPIVGFTVQYSHNYEKGIWRNISVKDPTKTEQQITLSPYANYTFRVIAFNTMGESKPSEPSHAVCESNPASPDNHPRRVTTDRSKPGVLIIKWDKMYPIEHNGPGFKYRVSIRKDGKTNTSEISDWNENIKEIDFGKIYEPFEVYVESVNDEGTPSSPALLYRAYTGESVPLVVPENFELVKDINVTATSATFQWDPVDKSPQAMQGEFTGYEIRFWKADQRETTLQRVKISQKAPPDPRVRRATKEIASINSLPPYSKLEAEVVACNTLYSSNASNNVSLETEEGVPGPVRNGRVLLRGSHHFLLEWEKPEPDQHNGIIVGYSIDYYEVNTFLPGKIQQAAEYDDPDRTKAYVEGLKASQEYRIYIYARTKVGRGAEFPIDAKTANNEAPIKPQMRIALVGEDFINVTWNVATNSDNPAGHSYYVQYRKTGVMEWNKTEKERYRSWMNVSDLTPNTRYELGVVAVSDVGEEVSELDTIVTTGNAPSTKPETNIAQATWFILMMVAIAVLILFLIIVCFIKRSRGEKYNVQEQEKLGGADPESPDNNLYNDYPRSGETDLLAAGSPDSFDNDPDKLLGGSETDSMAEYGDVDPSKFNEDGSFIGQYGSSKPEEKGNQPSAMSTFV